MRILAAFVFALVAIAQPTLAENPDPAARMVMCTNFARANAIICAISATPTIHGQEDQEFIAEVCAQAGVATYRMCLDESQWTRYEAVPSCLSAQRFAGDMVLKGGEEAMKKILPSAREAAQNRINLVAMLSSINAYKSCQHERQTEQDQANSDLDI